MISVVIPAHNEEAVILRTIRSIVHGSRPGQLDVVVVCNGCTDDTASVARSFGPPVRVIETRIASKTHALNVGDRIALAFPRVYVDADILVTYEAICSLAHRLQQGDVLAVAPTASVDFTKCSWPVQAYYEIRSMLPSAREGIGGSGVYALSQAGRDRFHEFPAVVADDGYVRIQFREQERHTLHDVTSTVFPPRTLASLIATKTRSHYGSEELKRRLPELWSNRGQRNDFYLLSLFKYPWLWVKLVAYCIVTLVAKWKAQRWARGEGMTWERDNTSRVVA